ncbi:MAG: septum formation protein Maf [Ruminococcus sp.]|nr:septum formation protein Maf [Ruminococcus sp.]MBR2305419.1 septum formation protein Maf [Ruminococcus sp.]
MSLKIINRISGCDVILASASPRRKELLELITDNFRVIPSDCDETLPEGIVPEDTAEYLSRIKCMSIAEVYESSIVIGCDTVVICGEVMGKPSDREDAERMLRLLSGRTHKVITGVTLAYKGKSISFSEVTEVTFLELSDEDIALYLDSGEPFDKAGAYGIQGLGSMLVSGIKGDFFNVVGLPVSRLAGELGTFLESV